MCRAYLCIIRPGITFGHFIWGSKAQKYTEQFDKVQALALRLTGHLRYGTPKAGMNIILNVPPLRFIHKI